MIIYRKIKALIFTLLRFLEFKIIHIDDSSQRIARGVAVGLIVAYSPFLGFQTLIALALAVPMKANKFAAASFVWVSNIFTLIPVYYPCFMVGHWVTKGYMGEERVTITQFKEFYFELVRNDSGVFSREFWDGFSSFFGMIGFELIIGGIIIGLAVATIGYFVTERLVTWYRNHPKFRLRIPHIKKKIAIDFKKKTKNKTL